MAGRKRMMAAILLLAVCLSGLFLFAAAEETAPEQPAPMKVDEMYDRSVTEGYAMRFPGEQEIPESVRQAIRENGTVERSTVLDAAFAALEEGNPFLDRYNIITGAEIRPLLPYGIPYFFGGRFINIVMENAPNYRTFEAWQSSKIYYRKYMKYFMGFDCRGLIEYVLKEAGIPQFTISRYASDDALDRKVAKGTSGRVQLRRLRRYVRVGDVIAVYHPGVHMMFYIGKLSDYGYTEDDFPEDPKILEYPLVIHCGVNAVYADWFYHIKEMYPIYRNTSVPDGGVTVSLLGYDNPDTIRSVIQQKQETAWVQMPDDTWLTVIRWDEVESWSVYR